MNMYDAISLNKVAHAKFKPQKFFNNSLNNSVVFWLKRDGD